MFLWIVEALRSRRMPAGGWFTSSYSGAGGQCVEVLFRPGGGAWVRDSKRHGRGPVLRFTAAEWDAFVNGAHDGEFTNPG